MGGHGSGRKEENLIHWVRKKDEGKKILTIHPKLLIRGIIVPLGRGDFNGTQEKVNSAIEEASWGRIILLRREERG